MSFAPSTLVTTQTGEQTISRLAVGVTVLAASSASTACAGGLGGLSFSADTLVQTPSGEQPIASLQVGDHVTSYDPQTGKATTQTITHVYLNHDTDRLNVTLALLPAAAPRPRQPQPRTRRLPARSAPSR